MTSKLDLQETANRVASVPLLAVDTETRDPNLKEKGPGFVRGDAEVVGISLAWATVGDPAHSKVLSTANVPDRSMQVGKDMASVYLPIAHEGGGNLDKYQVLAMLHEALHQRKNPVVMANAAYDLEALSSHGINMSCPVYDVQIAEALLDENRRSYKLDVLAQEYLGERKLTDALTGIAVEKLGVKKDKAMGHIWRLSASEVAEYACADAALTLGIWQKQEQKIVQEDLCRVWQLECELVHVVHAMRWHGVRIDMDAAERFVAVQQIARAIYQQKLGVEVQIWSSDSVSDAAKYAGAPPLVKEGEKDSFTSPAMEKETHPFFVNLVAARRVDKAITYVQSLLDYQINGRVHCQYHQTRDDKGGAKSGRLSASHPNLQAVPKRHEELAKPIRQLFLPDEGQLWCSNDYSQAEPRITVHYAHAMGLTGAAAARQKYIDDPATDYHQMVADMCNTHTGGQRYLANGQAIEMHPVTRFVAKTLNLGLAYGMGKKKLATALALPIEEATVLFEKYHNGVPFVRLLSERCTVVASKRGYVKTITGRRRRFDLWGPRRWEQGMVPKKFEEAKEEWGPNVTRYFIHRAMNAVVQGTAADICKTAMVTLYKEGILPLMSIHDDLPCSIAQDPSYFDHGSTHSYPVRLIKHIMETCLPLSVPHLVQPAIGPTWGDCK